MAKKIFSSAERALLAVGMFWLHFHHPMRQAWRDSGFEPLSPRAYGIRPEREIS